MAATSKLREGDIVSRIKTGRRALAWSIFVALAGVSAAALSQDESAKPQTPDGGESITTLGATVVTAQKREEALQDVPITMEVVPKQLLKDAGIHDIKDLQILVPGLSVTSTGLARCIEEVVEASGWRERRGALGEGRGLGLACSVYMSGAAHSIYRSELPHSAVTVKLDRSGAASVFCGTAEIGQGSTTMLAAVVGELLGLELADITVVEADTDLTPVDLGSYSSRVTFMCGSAAYDAALQLRRRLEAGLGRGDPEEAPAWGSPPPRGSALAARRPQPPLPVV